MTCTESEQIDSVGASFVSLAPRLIENTDRFGADAPATRVSARSLIGWVFNGFGGRRGTVVQAWTYCPNVAQLARIASVSGFL